MARTADSETTIDDLLQKRLIVCVGCGGVGKTTSAAALALAGALRGRQTAVITVDPARRLKDALGLGGLSADPHRVEINHSDNIHFDALALDTKRTFDDLVRRFAGSEAAAERILQNRLYHELSNELAGSAEYMAMEKLHELAHLHRYQLIVVDTPPSAHIRDLLAAPNRLLSLLATRAVSVLKSPGSILGLGDSAAARVVLSTLLNALKSWTGLDLLSDLSDFISGFEHMLDGFARRAEEVTELLHAPSTAFVLVTSAEPRTVETTIGFHEELAAGKYPVAGIIANRVIELPAMKPPADLATLPPLQRKLWRNYRELRELARRDEMALMRLRTETGLPLLATVRATNDAPTSIAGLKKFAVQLTGRKSTREKAAS